MATIAGNLLQRTGSPYFRHIDFPTTVTEESVDGNLLKAKSLGIDCSNDGGRAWTWWATGGQYPGDFGVALLRPAAQCMFGASGERSIAAREFFSPALTQAPYQTALKPDEIVVACRFLRPAL